MDWTKDEWAQYIEAARQKRRRDITLLMWAVVAVCFVAFAAVMQYGAHLVGG